MRKLPVIVFGLISLFTFGSRTGQAQYVDLRFIQLKSSSPFEIAKVVNRSRRLWSKNQIYLEVDLRDTWRLLGINSSNFTRCIGNCEAVIYRHQLDPTPMQEVILKLTESLDVCRYLIFVRVRHPAGKIKWQLRGYIDHDFNRYELSRHRTISLNHRNFLVVRGQEGSGSG